MVTHCPAIAFTLPVPAKARLLNKRYPEHLERNLHKSIEDWHEDMSCGMQSQHKWSRQHKYLLASMDVKNPQANFNDLENSVPPEESNDDLLDQAWDDHRRESLDAKKVKASSLRWRSITTRCTCSIKCLLLNAGRGQARRP